MSEELGPGLLNGQCEAERYSDGDGSFAAKHGNEFYSLFFFGHTQNLNIRIKASEKPSKITESMGLSKP